MNQAAAEDPENVLSPSEQYRQCEVRAASLIDRIGHGGGGFAIVAARVELRTGFVVGRVVVVLDRVGRPPICVRIRDGEELDRVIAALEAARRELQREGSK